MLLQQAKTQEEKISQRITQLIEGRVAEREEAESYLRNLDEAETQALLRLFVQECRQNRRQQRRSFWASLGIAVMVLISLCVALVCMMLLAPPSLESLFSGLGDGLFSGLSSDTRKERKSPTTQRQKVLLRVLTRIEDIRVIGALTEALGFSDTETRQAAENALLPLLRQMQPCHAMLLDASQRQSLYRALNGNYPNLIVAILGAVERLEDTEALPYVQRLANGRGCAARDTRLRMVAKSCLLVLQRRKEQEQVRLTLLRASSALPFGTKAASTLLRPAGPTPSTEPEQLLRATTDVLPTTIQERSL